jgi:hypothetical protein
MFFILFDFVTLDLTNLDKISQETTKFNKTKIDILFEISLKDDKIFMLYKKQNKI